MKEKVDAAHKSLESGCAVSKSIQGEIQKNVHLSELVQHRLDRIQDRIGSCRVFFSVGLRKMSL